MSVPAAPGPVGILTRLFGTAVSGAAGFAAGTALGPTLSPIVRLIANDVNAHFPYVPPPAGTLALGVAQGQVDPDLARKWAKMHGVGDAAFAALVDVANTGPGVPLAFDLWRRGKIGEAGFRRAAKRQGLEQEWIDRLVEVFHTVLDPADLARGIHRGLVPDPGLLQGDLPSGEGNVPAYPVYDIDAVAEALAAGFDKDHLGVLVGLQGNPMGAHEAAAAQFRGILTRNDYLRAIAEGNTRNEWADAIREQSRQIPTARDFLENALRGYRTLTVALKGAGLHGMTPEHATMLYQNQGRPMNVRQITQALARGGKFQPEPGEITDPYRASIVEGNLKPGYYDLADALKYTMPSPFAIRQLATSGVWDEDKTRTRLLWLGWEPGDAADVAKAWTSGGGTAGDAHVGRAQTQLWSRAHTSYLAAEISEDDARAALPAAGVAAASVDDVLALWNAERELERKQLTPAQVKKAFTKGVENPATGSAWTKDEATAALVARGYSTADATTFLEI